MHAEAGAIEAVGEAAEMGVGAGERRGEESKAPLSVGSHWFQSLIKVCSIGSAQQLVLKGHFT